MIEIDAPLRTHYGKLYIPRPVQTDFHSSDKKFRAFLAGLGSGKSLTGATETVLHALRYPGSMNLVARWSMGALRDTSWKVLKTILLTLDPRLIEGEPLESNNRLQITLVNGSVIIGMHLQNWMAFGSLDLSTFWVDEVTEVENSEAFDMLCARLGRHPIGPPGGRGWVTGTPNGKDWVWKYFVHDPTEDYQFFTCSTWDNLENLPEGYVDRLYQRWGKAKAEMLLKASFDAVDLKVFPEFDPGIHVVDARHTVWTHMPVEWPRYRAIDPGIATSHPAACVWAALDASGNIWVYDLFHQSDLVVEQIARAILKKTGSDEIRWTVIDPSSQNRSDQTGDTRLEAYRRAGIKALRPADNDILNGIELLRSLFYVDPDRVHPLTGKFGAPRIFIKSDLRQLISELLSYRFPKVGAYRSMTQRPIARDNDCVDALRYLMMERPVPAVESVKPLNEFWQRILRPDIPSKAPDLRRYIGSQSRSPLY